MNYTKALLSGSTDGLPISVGTVATVVHTAIAGSIAFDELYVYAVNTDVADHTLTLVYDTGGAVRALCMTLTIPANSPPTPILTGKLIQNGHVLNATADVAGAINCIGWVNRIQ